MSDDYPCVEVPSRRGYQVAAGISAGIVFVVVAAYALGLVGEMVGGVIAGLFSAIALLLVVATGR